MKPAADEAVAEVPTVERVVVLENLGVDVPMKAGRDVTWDEFTARVRRHVHASTPPIPPPRTRS